MRILYPRPLDTRCPTCRTEGGRRRNSSCAPRSGHASHGCSAQPDGVASATPSTARWWQWLRRGHSDDQRSNGASQLRVKLCGSVLLNHASAGRSPAVRGGGVRGTHWYREHNLSKQDPAVTRCRFRSPPPSLVSTFCGGEGHKSSRWNRSGKDDVQMHPSSRGEEISH